jgi:ABC-type Fe3+-hydroxamate transport system substrate-binding protein
VLTALVCALFLHSGPSRDADARAITDAQGGRVEVPDAVTRVICSGPAACAF